MKFVQMLALAAVMAATSIGCGKKEETGEKPETEPTASADKPEPTDPNSTPPDNNAGTETADGEEDEAAAIPTEADFEEIAAEEVTSKNLEAELGKLEKEIVE